MSASLPGVIATQEEVTEAASLFGELLKKPRAQLPSSKGPPANPVLDDYMQRAQEEYQRRQFERMYEFSPRSMCRICGGRDPMCPHKGDRRW